MGYNLYIGEMKVDEPDFEEGEFVYTHVGVEKNSGEEIGAPINSTDNHSNEIWPSYTGWSNFCDTVGLMDVFYRQKNRTRETGILDNHPGCIVLCQRHVYRFEKALKEYQTVKREGETVEYNYRRLEWLVFWSKWALKNCKVPAFANS